VGKANDPNRPDSARQASGGRREFKFEAVWENDIKLDLPGEANPDAPPEDNRKSLSQYQSQEKGIKSPRSLSNKSSLRGSRISRTSSLRAPPMTKCEILKFLFQLLGANVSVVNNVCDILYVYSMKFERNLIFNLISIFILVRVGVMISIFLS